MAESLFWLSERGRDVLMWPVNLVRDFPVRASRLLGTGRHAVAAIAAYPRRRRMATVSDAAMSKPPTELTGPAEWLHRLVAQIFDLVGGPEVAQFLMHLITHTTPLTSEEMALITSLLGPDSLRYRDVRVAEGGLMDLVFKFNGNLAFSTWHTVHFPSTARRDGTDHTRANLAIVVHELTHVYQYETVGSRYLGEAIYVLIKTKRDCYNYGLARGLKDAAASGKQFCDFNREQQAQIVQDYHALRVAEQDTSAYDPFINQLRAGAL